jgi:deoxyxylulose-5-phosphate synthase
MNKITPPKAETTPEEMISWFKDNMSIERDNIIIKIPTEKELEALKTSPTSGLYLGELRTVTEAYRYIVLAVGENVKNKKAGDKVIIGTDKFHVTVINGYTVGKVEDYYVIGTFNK